MMVEDGQDGHDGQDRQRGKWTGKNSVGSADWLSEGELRGGGGDGEER